MKRSTSNIMMMMMKLVSTVCKKRIYIHSRIYIHFLYKFDYVIYIYIYNEKDRKNEEISRRGILCCYLL